MGDRGAKPTCLSAQHHGAEVIRDFPAHYFGCIEISDRPQFLNRSNPLWDEELRLQEEKLRQQNGKKGDEIKDFKGDAEKNIEKKIRGLAVSIESQYKRTDILRKAIRDVGCTHLTKSELAEFPEGRPPDCNLVDCLVDSHARWKETKEFRDGIEKIRQWKKQRERQVDSTPPDAMNVQHDTMDPGRIAVRRIIQQTREDAFEEETQPGKYELERDINGYVIQWDIVGRKGLRNNESKSGHQSTNSDHSLPKKPTQQVSTPQIEVMEHHGAIENSPNESLRVSEEPGGRRASMVPPQRASFYKSSSRDEKYLKPAEENTTEDYRFKGHFPGQRLSLQYLLEEKPSLPKKDDVVLCKNRHPDRVRYIHIPHNNMEWIERAIACYFRDDKPDHGCLYREPPVKTKSHMILRPEYWRGQQHGGRRSMVHARHMRPICERVSSEIWDSEDNPANLVLFMPYLHWEEDRKREKVARIIEDETSKCHEKREIKAKKGKNDRIQERTFNGEPLRSKKPLDHPPDDPRHLKRVKEAWEKNAFGGSDGRSQRTVTELAGGLAPGGPIEDEYHEEGRSLWYVAKLESGKHGRITAQTKLGQFLLDAARLYEAITMYRDQQLLETYLHHDPPLHPRRTLDQSYYWTLKTTKARDRDQVVYRGTTMDERNVHRFREEGKKNCPGAKNCIKKKTLLRKILDSEETTEECTHKPEKLGKFRWDDHCTQTDLDGCDHCRGEIRKVSRVVMVDQLWMWILDKQTIITSFPKRYGNNKSDPSGVHKSIRDRIKNARKNQIRSVFDVALIILDECSNTFFDRTKTPDRHPQVMDIFGDAIGNLTNLQTVSFQHLWHWTERASQVYISKSKYEDASHLHLPLLNINPEGKLQREIKDILDELDIMISINNKQRDVIKRFTKHVENIFDASGEWRDNMKSMSSDDDRDYRKTSSRPSSLATATKANDGDETDGDKEMEQFIWFRKQAYDLISDVGDRVLELEGLRKSAESTAQGIKDLLDLKQQQASILQAWQSVKQADESVRQGRSIMIFTIVTIIFLPLSFMSSVFGMNNSTIGSDIMTFGDQANFMFPISAAVILVSIVFAFWTFPRTVFWSAYKMLETWLLVKSGAYYYWLVIREEYKNLRSEDLLKSLEKEVAEMKGKVKKQRRRDKINEEMNSEGQSNEPEGDAHLQNGNGRATAADLNTRQEQASDSGTTDVASLSSWSRLYRRKKVPDAGV
ncbi:hypothetical protein CGCF415_v006584 [Colletotrichum fructicola]|nr:hypothetical protein CGCF415_v006584 [Colletotrichum fructicola]